MTTTLRDLIDLDLEVDPPVEAGALRLHPLFPSSPAATDSLWGPVAEAAGALLVQEHGGVPVRRRSRHVQADNAPEM